eukprot:8919669-Lingulodinium_polyedra.AAC.1
MQQRAVEARDYVVMRSDVRCAVAALRVRRARVRQARVAKVARARCAFAFKMRSAFARALRRCSPERLAR